jgi:hypothetical protein
MTYFVYSSPILFVPLIYPLPSFLPFNKNNKKVALRYLLFSTHNSNTYKSCSMVAAIAIWNILPSSVVTENFQASLRTNWAYIIHIIFRWCQKIFQIHLYGLMRSIFCYILIFCMIRHIFEKLLSMMWDPCKVDHIERIWIKINIHRTNFRMYSY